jgi:1,4-alpha-glucan branching enzyme
MTRTKKKVKTAVKPRRRRTVFYLDAPDAGEVFLAGDFNDWSLQRHRMQKDENGMWKKIAMLFPGRYEYKFLVDDQWQTDPGNDRMCRNCFGTQNNIIDVKAG